MQWCAGVLCVLCKANRRDQGLGEETEWQGMEEWDGLRDGDGDHPINPTRVRGGTSRGSRWLLPAEGRLEPDREGGWGDLGCATPVGNKPAIS